MTIRKAPFTTPIVAGQWVCKASALDDAICNAPQKVKSVSSTRVYLVDADASYITLSSVMFVCDTKKEADSMHALSKQQEADLRGTKLEIIESYMQRIEQMVSKP